MSRVGVGLVTVAALALDPPLARAQQPAVTQVGVTCELKVSRFTPSKDHTPQFGDVKAREKKLLDRIVASLKKKSPCWGWVTGGPAVAGYRLRVAISQAALHGAVTAKVVVHKPDSPDTAPSLSEWDYILVKDHAQKKVSALNDFELYDALADTVDTLFAANEESHGKLAFVPVTTGLTHHDKEGWVLPIKKADLGPLADATLTFRVEYCPPGGGRDDENVCMMTFEGKVRGGFIVVFLVKGDAPPANATFIGVYLKRVLKDAPAPSGMPPSP